MLALIVLLSLIGYILVSIVSQKDFSFYRDVRFWLVMASVCVLVWITASGFSS